MHRKTETDRPARGGQWQTAAWALLGGGLYALGNIGFGWWPLALVCLIPFWHALEQVRYKGTMPLLRVGLLFGLGIYLCGFQWLTALAEQFVSDGILARTLWLIVGLLFALSFSFYALLHAFLRRSGLPFWASAATPWLALEWLQFNLFPAYLGLGLIEQFEIAQLASLGGPLTLSAFALAANLIFYRLLKRRSRCALKTILIQAALLGTLTGSYALIAHESAIRDLQGETLAVGLVQNNVVRLEKHKQGRQSHARNLSLSRDLLANNAIDLLIWPESSYSLALRRPLPLDAQFIRADLEVPLLFGGTSSWHAAGRSASANTLFFANQKGQIQQAYDKQSLIPFAESLPGLGAIAAFEKSPFGSLWPTIQSDYVSYVQELFPWHQQFKPGPESGVIQVGDFRIATPICFEMIQADTVRNLVSENAANLIVTIANDAWFGTSQEPWIHLKLSRLRAIEHGLWVVRATNSGISAIINPRGEISAQTGLFRAETLASSVQARPATTPYTRLGDWPGPAALILGCALWIRSRLTQRSLQTRLPASSHN